MDHAFPEGTSPEPSPSAGSLPPSPAEAGLPIRLLEPMTPILSDTIPEGGDWGHQIKWDGVRMLSFVRGQDVRMFSRRLLPKNDGYPDVVDSLRGLRMKRDFLLDGEVVVFDQEKMRPDFQLVLQRERLKNRSLIGQYSARQPAVYVLFDLLYADGEDLRPLPYLERHERLASLFPDKTPALFVTDLFRDGRALWDWVASQGWEGIVSKRLSSPYRENKKHRDWFKKKTAVLHEVAIIGLTVRGGQIASLVMAKDGRYFGKVSIGLNEEWKRKLLPLAQESIAAGIRAPFRPLPQDLRPDTIGWLARPFPCLVTGLEVTSGGVLRHPRIAQLKEEDISHGNGGQKRSDDRRQ